MRKIAFLLALVMILATAANAFAVDFTLGPGRDATQTGKVTLTADGAKTKVMIDAAPGPAGATTPQPAHIHEGTCPGVGRVAFPLTNVVNGKSETTVDVSLADLQSKAYSINLHRSGTEAGIYTACVNLQTMTTAAALPKTGGVPLPLLLGAGSVLAAAGYVFRRRS